MPIDEEPINQEQFSRLLLESEKLQKLTVKLAASKQDELSTLIKTLEDIKCPAYGEYIDVINEIGRIRPRQPESSLCPHCNGSGVIKKD